MVNKSNQNCTCPWNKWKSRFYSYLAFHYYYFVMKAPLSLLRFPMTYLQVLSIVNRLYSNILREQGWRSGESARLPPVWPGFDSRTRHHMWVEFVVGSLLAPRGFSPGTSVLPFPQKPTFLNSSSIRNSRATGLSVARLLSLTLVKQSRFILLLNSIPAYTFLARGLAPADVNTF